MTLTRAQLINEFTSLDEELSRLDAAGETEEAFRLAFERMVYTSTRTVAQRDRLWWWDQLYATMDRHMDRHERLRLSECQAGRAAS
jgi:hypothetical protein